MTIFLRKLVQFSKPFQNVLSWEFSNPWSQAGFEFVEFCDELHWSFQNPHQVWRQDPDTRHRILDRNCNMCMVHKRFFQSVPILAARRVPAHRKLDSPSWTWHELFCCHLQRFRSILCFDLLHFWHYFSPIQIVGHLVWDWWVIQSYHRDPNRGLNLCNVICTVGNIGNFLCVTKSRFYKN